MKGGPLFMNHPVCSCYYELVQNDNCSYLTERRSRQSLSLMAGAEQREKRSTRNLEKKQDWKAFQSAIKDMR